MIDAADFPERVTRRARAVFTALAEAEGVIHGLGPDEIHLHEVGGHDAIIDVVGTAISARTPRRR